MFDAPVITTGMEIITDMNYLYDAYLKSLQGSHFKRSLCRFENNWLIELTKLKYELESKTYYTLPGSEFKLTERGKVRHIHGNHIRDRVVRHVFCDNILGPCIRPYLIYNNGASQKGKGLSFTRSQFEKDLHNFYLKNKSVNGYILFIDFSKFFDNIRHDKVKQMLYEIIPSDTHWLMDEILSHMEVDVSFMDDALYESCMVSKFNSLEYYEQISNKLKTNEKYMAKSVNIGDQVSQDLGVYFPHRIDNYCKIVRSIKFYGRYMDDIYIIHESKKFLLSVLAGIKIIAEDLGIFINENKTRIIALTQKFKYLNLKYFMTPTGKVVKRLCSSTLTRERHKLKAQQALCMSGVLPYDFILSAYKSWFGMHKSFMSKAQMDSINMWYFNLFKAK